ncbi:hypothetical protein KQH60_05595 [Mycetohabitans sp. B8]|uniref:hypothetical protein n=1 Tax=Mycetohabitans sp. B8 TaxID=2841845 RepID=UPI001F1B6E61|nr:hypothetical protein [Mycetohabitans sp. B8]MCG1042061.1 hypothetical protein [Mycetohabitans sp. B8]
MLAQIDSNQRHLLHDGLSKKKYPTSVTFARGVGMTILYLSAHGRRSRSLKTIMGLKAR